MHQSHVDQALNLFANKPDIGYKPLRAFLPDTLLYYFMDQKKGAQEGDQRHEKKRNHDLKIETYSILHIRSGLGHVYSGIHINPAYRLWTSIKAAKIIYF